MKHLNSFLCLAAFLALGATAAFAGTTTLTTYYPSPNGYYAHLTLLPGSDSAGTACPNTGSMSTNNNGALLYCVDNNINSNGPSPQSNGTPPVLIGGTLAGNGKWGNPQVAMPTNFWDTANKGYVDAAVGGGCYVSYSGSCLSGFTNKGSAGSWGYCSIYSCSSTGSCSYSYLSSPPGGDCPLAWFSTVISVAFVCCK